MAAAKLHQLIVELFQLKGPLHQTSHFIYILNNNLRMP